MLFDGVPYAYSAVAPPGTRPAFLAGACPLDPDGHVVGADDVVAQARQCVANLTLALADLDATLADLLFVRVLVASSSRSDLAAAWDVLCSALGEHSIPGTLLGVTVLGWPDQLVEIEAVAAVGQTSSARR